MEFTLKLFSNSEAHSPENAFVSLMIVYIHTFLYIHFLSFPPMIFNLETSNVNILFKHVVQESTDILKTTIMSPKRVSKMTHSLGVFLVFLSTIFLFVDLKVCIANRSLGSSGAFVPGFLWESLLSRGLAARRKV